VGVLIVDKPVGPTSFEVVRRVRRALSRLRGDRKPRDLKVGHGGTLDPLASGVLPVCLGEATKLAAFLLDADKEYVATVRFGAETDTLDAAGRVLREAPAGHLSASDVEAALAGFRGPIQQVPPMYSALKHEGQRLHALARAGTEVERAPRAVTVFALTLEGFVHGPAPEASVRVRCSKGTYVRVLGADLGRALGVGAHLSALRRTASGPFAIGEALPLDEVESRAAAGAWPALVSLSAALAHLPALVPPAPLAVALGQGKRLPCAALGLPDDASGRYRLLGVASDPSSAPLLAVVEAAGGVLRTVRGFQTSDIIPATVAAPANPGSAVARESKLSASVGLTSTHHL
jgi:tRNA pseudouridine55 synthase